MNDQLKVRESNNIITKPIFADDHIHLCIILITKQLNKC